MFNYKGDELSVSGSGGKTLRSVVGDEGPAYVYDSEALTHRARVFKSAVPKGASLHYALKANNHEGILKLLRAENIGLDVVSGGELEHGLRLGFAPDRIVFSGVGKSDGEIEAALKAGILQLNVESVPELIRIGEIAKAKKTKAKVALRVNPDVDAATHPYIRTGYRDNKFGIDIEDLGEAVSAIKESPQSLELRGLTLHIGSQIQDIQPFVDVFAKVTQLIRRLESDGVRIESLDVGGGVGIDYHAENEKGDEERIQAYGKALSELVKALPQVTLRLEPGRILVARCGALVTPIEYVKRTPHKNFVIVRTGMHHLMRPSLYQAYHRILPCRKSTASLETFDVVGPICESADTLGHERRLPSDIKAGDFLAIMDAGAYGAVMMSDYNMHPRAREILI